jgi:hypothetical protein
MLSFFSDTRLICNAMKVTRIKYTIGKERKYTTGKENSLSCVPFTKSMFS